MKRSAFALLLVLFCIQLNNAQQIVTGLSGGLPLGEASDASKFAINVDVGYLWDISEVVKMGAATGYSHSFGDTQTVNGFTVDANDFQYIPLAAALRVGIVDRFILGADVGYGIGISEDNDGGFYFSPRVHYKIFNPVDLVLTFRRLSTGGGSWDIISLGLEFYIY